MKMRRFQSVQGTIKRGNQSVIRGRLAEKATHRQQVILGNHDWMGNWCLDKEAWVIAGDGTLFGFQFEKLRERKDAVFICINDSILDVPFADLWCFLDPGVQKRLQIDVQNVEHRTLCGHRAQMTAGGKVTALHTVQKYNPWPSDQLAGVSTSTHLGICAALWGNARIVRVLGASSNHLDESQIEPFLAYARANSDWYNVTPEREQLLREHVRKNNVLQHYYGIDRYESHPRIDKGGKAKLKSTFYSMNASYKIFGSQADRIAIHSFMSRNVGLRQETKLP